MRSMVVRASAWKMSMECTPHSIPHFQQMFVWRYMIEVTQWRSLLYHWMGDILCCFHEELAILFWSSTFFFFYYNPFIYCREQQEVIFKKNRQIFRNEKFRLSCSLNIFCYIYFLNQKSIFIERVAYYM